MQQAISQAMRDWARNNALHASAIVEILTEVPEFAEAIASARQVPDAPPLPGYPSAPEADAPDLNGKQMVYSVVHGKTGQRTTQQERLDILGLKRGAFTTFRWLEGLDARPDGFHGEAKAIAAAIRAERGTGAFIGIGYPQR